MQQDLGSDIGDTGVNGNLAPTGPCLLEGTKIATPTGESKIEDIYVGDYVMSYNEKTKNIEPNKVLETFIHNESEYLIINDLKITGNHPVYVDGQIIGASHIQLGDTLTAINSTVVVTKIEKVIESQIVYNIEVENNHNYFAEGKLVHNKMPREPGPGGHIDSSGGGVERLNIQSPPRQSPFSKLLNPLGEGARWDAFVGRLDNPVTEWKPNGIPGRYPQLSDDNWDFNPYKCKMYADKCFCKPAAKYTYEKERQIKCVLRNCYEANGIEKAAECNEIASKLNCLYVENPLAMQEEFSYFPWAQIQTYARDNALTLIVGAVYAVSCFSYLNSFPTVKAYCFNPVSGGYTVYCGIYGAVLSIWELVDIFTNSRYSWDIMQSQFDISLSGTDYCAGSGYPSSDQLLNVFYGATAEELQACIGYSGSLRAPYTPPAQAAATPDTSSVGPAPASSLGIDATITSATAAEQSIGPSNTGNVITQQTATINAQKELNDGVYTYTVSWYVHAIEDLAYSVTLDSDTNTLNLISGSLQEDEYSEDVIEIDSTVNYKYAILEYGSQEVRNQIVIS